MSEWMEHWKNVKKSHPNKSLKEVLKMASKTFKSKKTMKKGGMSCGTKKSMKKGGMSCGTKKSMKKGGKKSKKSRK